ncbi:hypothetical protein BZA05DRAFT_422089 [Tricharina praecox]|uniref:uncharacterized protein n=1 Tax=Tricharina praecox TaxID=43433 RepID=UPI00221E5ED7|nr:uncharacterized protein BZA05DRAFT_422089 [Tricharina praecox]KAI5843774.1 hypothetical protein BZA05DRAFT_422089 [Tricharina praecox]
MATYINCTCGDPYCDGNGPQCYHPYNQVQGAPDIEVAFLGQLGTHLQLIQELSPRYPPVRGDLYRRRRGSRTPDDDAAVQLALLQSTEDFGGSSDYSSPYTPLDSPISRSPLRGGEDDFEEQLRRAISESEREAARARRTRRNPPSARQHPRRYPTPPATADDYEQQLQRALEESARDAAPPPRIRPSEPAAHHPRVPFHQYQNGRQIVDSRMRR